MRVTVSMMVRQVGAGIEAGQARQAGQPGRDETLGGVVKTAVCGSRKSSEILRPFCLCTALIATSWHETMRPTSKGKPGQLRRVLSRFECLA